MHLKQIAVSLFVSLSVCMPAGYCLSFDEILRTYLGTGNPSSTGAISVSEQALIKTNINNRQAQLEAQLAAGAQSGQLDANEEADLRAQLTRIANLEGTYLADGALTRWEVQSLLEELNNFSIRMNTYLTNATTVTTPTAGLGMNQGWYRRHNRINDGYLANLRAFQADIDTKQAQIDAAITDGTNSGRLSWSQSSQLRAELNKLAADESQFTADGRLSSREAQQLIAELDALNAKVTALSQWRRSAHNRRGNWGTNIDRRQSLLRQRIQAGIASGQLTRSESARLLAEDAKITALEDRLRSSGNRLSFNEQRRLLNELDLLTQKLTRELNDRQVQ